MAFFNLSVNLFIYRFVHLIFHPPFFLLTQKKSSMDKIDNGDTLKDIKKRIANILYKNDVAISKPPTEEVSDILDNSLVSKQKTKPESNGDELKLDPSKTIISEINANGIITSVNVSFLEISGYKKFELLGQLYNINYHPNLPTVIFEKIWAKLETGRNFRILVKNLAKDGRYFWSLNYFETITDKNDNIISHHIKGRAIPDSIVSQIERIYNTLESIEERKGVKASYNYLVGLIEDENCSYDGFILETLASNIGIRTTSTNKLIARKVLNKRRKDLLVSFFNKKTYKL